MKSKEEGVEWGWMGASSTIQRKPFPPLDGKYLFFNIFSSIFLFIFFTIFLFVLSASLLMAFVMLMSYTHIYLYILIIIYPVFYCFAWCLIHFLFFCCLFSVFFSLLALINNKFFSFSSVLLYFVHIFIFNILASRVHCISCSIISKALFVCVCVRVFCALLKLWIGGINRSIEQKE